MKRPNKITGANSRPALQFESSGLRRRAPVVGSRGRYHGRRLSLTSGVRRLSRTKKNPPYG